MRLSKEGPAPADDPWGRALIVYNPSLTQAEQWERNPGVWTVKLSVLEDVDLAVLTRHTDDTVVAVGTAEAARFYGRRSAIEGTGVQDHPLVGQPDPVPTQARNPFAYGYIPPQLGA